MTENQSLYELVKTGNNNKKMIEQKGWHNLSDLWYSFSMRLSTTASNALKSNHEGVARVTVEVYVDAKGDPIYWLEPEVKRVEPSGSARTNLRKVTGL